jgi:hypothetical protein
VHEQAHTRTHTSHHHHKREIDTYITNTGVVGHHESTDTVFCLHVGRLSRETHLNTGRSPRDETCQFSFADSLQTLVYLNQWRTGEGGER